ncbi:hypothetical protein [Natronolimnohabitans innermongolicus]|uniref:Uncharacterized protein n=1 Tax=Natronolimnohabitans innermongolicus JCM 12255 TaxID=1227499 RepID=L9X6N5_9EURY|nr:hypothetical protein [Natronolimnohabitans innermongolicus]ELY57449.1 hypothetical protein C493_08186 [Natronolimnohabitans innermongolicus JCM 12255]
MNRRTVLGLAGTSVAASLAGCLDGVREHFGLQGVIPVEIHNEGEQSHNVQLRAVERGSSRDSYEQSFTVTPDETVGPPHLDETEQSLRVAIIEDDELANVQTADITPDTSLVTIRLYDDDFVIEVRRDEGEDVVEEGNESDEPDNQTDAENGDENDETNSSDD